MKYHQLFKNELECSFIEFSSDRSCICPIHNNFGMNYIDIHSVHDTIFLSGNRFFINIDIFGIMGKMKDKSLNNKEALSVMNNQLFLYYQNYRLGNEITNPVNEY